MSKDSVSSHQKFAEKHGLPFILLSDPELTVLQAYGVWQEKKMYGKVSMGVVRSAYVIDEAPRSVCPWLEENETGSADNPSKFSFVRYLSCGSPSHREPKTAWGGGHRSYMTEINTIASAGFAVLAYDNTGTMASEGKSLGSFYQAVRDLQAALAFLRKNSEWSRYPVVLAGHSWGGYAVCQAAAVAAAHAVSEEDKTGKLPGISPEIPGRRKKCTVK